MVSRPPALGSLVIGAAVLAASRRSTNTNDLTVKSALSPGVITYLVNPAAVSSPNADSAARITMPN